ncbi:MAG: M64 family metallopeptidase [Bacteroidota bacterium]|nr:M64 family metallopeptidase [Bacteroidota bacterium]
MQKLVLLLFLSVVALNVNAQFDKYFQPKTLRFDYYHCGNHQSESIFFDELIEEPHWGGSKVNLVDDNNYGSNYLKVYDLESNKLIFSRGYCTLFDEWQTVDEARQTNRCFPESVIMPFPRKSVRLELLSRNKKGVFEKKFEYTINPESYFIKKERPNWQVFDVAYSGDPAHKVDVVLLSEGYTADQYEQFKSDCAKFAEALFSYTPYRENRSKFNIRGVWAPSQESGVDIPGENQWRKTNLDASYYTFNSERYQMVTDFQKVRDMASCAPYDYIYILSNTQKYGGGAIYNFYGISAAGHKAEAGKIYVHEFGHLFLGLADEYVGGVEYNDFYPLNVEPWEPNLTTLVDFDKKWKNQLDPQTPVPTPATKENAEVLGVYEGGGYVAKGVYRPWMNCMMNNIHTTDKFCPVCVKAIQNMIDFQCK